MNKPSLLYGAVFLSFFLVLLLVSEPKVALPASDGTSSPEWSAAPGTLLSSATGAGADTPVIAHGPEGEFLIVVYNHWIGDRNNRDPYFTIYEEGTWSAPAAVHASPGSDSGNVAVAVDGQGRAHAVWVEPEQGVYYARWQGTSWTAPERLSLEGGFLFIAPAIVATGEGVIDVVWGQNRPPTAGNPSIYHSRSQDGGANWSVPEPAGGAPTAPTSLAPALAVDGSGTIHVAWQETTISDGQSGYNLLYTQKTNLWSQPIILSPDLRSAEQPTLLAEGNRLHLTFTRSEVVEDVRRKWIYYSGCSSNCSLQGSWLAITNISAQPVGVSESDPFWSISDVVTGQGCTYVFFYGFIPDQTPVEQVWEINSCDGWSNGGRAPVTAADTRALYPATTSYDTGVHLVYERVSGSSHAIYYLTGEVTRTGTRYLPLIARR